MATVDVPGMWPRWTLPQMRDCWLGEPHDSCHGRCSFLLHKMLDRHLRPPAAPARLTELDGAISQLFESRFTFGFIREDIYAHVRYPSDDSYYTLRAAQQRVPIDLRIVKQAMGALYGILGKDQRSALAHLGPVAKALSDTTRRLDRLRRFAAHAEGGVYGLVSQMDSVRAGEDTLETLSLLSTHLVEIFVDGVMHSHPDMFSNALGKTYVADMCAMLPDFRTFPDTSEEFRSRHPISLIPASGMKGADPKVMSELMKLRWAFRLPIPIMSYINCVQVAMPQMPLLWIQLWRHKIVFWARHLVIELANFFDLHDKMRARRIVPGGGIPGAVRARQGAIGDLRDLAAHWRPPPRFSRELEEKIGYEDLLLVTGWAAEWARVNANAYQEMGFDSSDRIRSPDNMVRRLALGEVACRAERLRSEAVARQKECA